MESPRESESSKDRGRYKSCREKAENVNPHHQFPPLATQKEAAEWLSSGQVRGWKNRALVAGLGSPESREFKAKIKAGSLHRGAKASLFLLTVRG